MPVPSSDLDNFQRFDPQIRWGKRLYVLAQHLCYSAATLALLWHAQNMDYWQQLTTVLLLTFGLVVNGRILDDHPVAAGAELVRLGILSIAIPLLPAASSALLAVYVLCSVFAWWWLAFANKKDTVALVNNWQREAKSGHRK